MKKYSKTQESKTLSRGKSKMSKESKTPITYDVKKEIEKMSSAEVKRLMNERFGIQAQSESDRYHDGAEEQELKNLDRRIQREINRLRYDIGSI